PCGRGPGAALPLSRPLLTYHNVTIPTSNLRPLSQLLCVRHVIFIAKYEVYIWQRMLYIHTSRSQSAATSRKAQCVCKGDKLWTVRSKSLVGSLISPMLGTICTPHPSRCLRSCHPKSISGPSVPLC